MIDSNFDPKPHFNGREMKVVDIHYLLGWLEANRNACDNLKFLKISKLFMDSFTSFYQLSLKVFDCEIHIHSFLFIVFIFRSVFFIKKFHDFEFPCQS